MIKRMSGIKNYNELEFPLVYHNSKILLFASGRTPYDR